MGELVPKDQRVVEIIEKSLTHVELNSKKSSENLPMGHERLETTIRSSSFPLFISYFIQRRW